MQSRAENGSRKFGVLTAAHQAHTNYTFIALIVLGILAVLNFFFYRHFSRIDLTTAERQAGVKPPPEDDFGHNHL